MIRTNQPIQVVCMLDDLKSIFEEWKAEQVENERKQAQEAQKDEYLTVEQVGKLLDVSKPTLWRWAKIGYLIPVKVGHKNYYRQSDIDALRKG